MTCVSHDVTCHSIVTVTERIPFHCLRVSDVGFRMSDEPYHRPEFMFASDVIVDMIVLQNHSKHCSISQNKYFISLL